MEPCLADIIRKVDSDRKHWRLLDTLTVTRLPFNIYHTFWVLIHFSKDNEERTATHLLILGIFIAFFPFRSE